MKCDIEIFLNGMWQRAASFELRSPDEIRNGYKGAGFFEYDLDYALVHLNSGAIDAVSCLYPVSFEIQRNSCWQRGRTPEKFQCRSEKDKRGVCRICGNSKKTA